MEENKIRIRTFEDLEVYKESYRAMLVVHKEIIPYLPREEKYDLSDQLRRSTKAIPRLIAEGHSKRHQKKGFQKYLDDALAESNETIVSLCQCKDLYGACVDGELCKKLIDEYDKISRKIYKLAVAWEDFGDRKRSTFDVSSCSTAQRLTRFEK